MHKFTKIFLKVVAGIVFVFAAWYGLNLYGFNHTKVEITFYTDSRPDGNSFTVPQLSLEPNSTMGVSEEWDNRYFEIYDVIGEMISLCQSHTDAEQWNFDSTVEIDGEKTLFTVVGTYTENGEQKEVVQHWTLDYVVTKNIVRTSEPEEE